MEQPGEWDNAQALVELDRVSFEDSERFEEDDSICSWQSESESLLNQKWSEWNPSGSDIPGPSNTRKSNRAGMAIQSLIEICSQKVAAEITFEEIEKAIHSLKEKPIYASILAKGIMPQQILTKILRNCFPVNADNIRTYSFITNGSHVSFETGKAHFDMGDVHDVFQIGYHISAQVKSIALSAQLGAQASTSKGSGGNFNVCVKVDRCRIISCSCSCDVTSWCVHVIAVCLYRINKPNSVEYRVPIWDSISELSDKKLKKFAQHMINEGRPETILIAQKLLDQLDDDQSEINQKDGAPDPTAGNVDDVATWYMDEKQLHESIRKILIAFVKPGPVACDISYLSNNCHQTSAEFTTLITTHYNRVPSQLWRLLDFVIRMLERGDENAFTLLHAITEHCLCVDQVLGWWYQTRLIETGHWHCGTGTARASQQNPNRFNASSLCEEIVRLWGLCALNPNLSNFEKEQLGSLLRLYHQTAVNKIWKMLETSVLDCNLTNSKGVRLSTNNAPFSEQFFPGFFTALQLCFLDFKNASVISQFNKIDLSAFSKQLHETSSKSMYKCVNIPILKHGADVLVLEFLDTEQQITSTISNQHYEHKVRSKRFSRRKRNRRDVVRNSQIMMQNQLRRDFNENSEDSAGEDTDPLARGQDRLKQEAYHEQVNLLFAKAHEEMNKMDQKIALCTALMTFGFDEEATEVANVLAGEFHNNITFTLNKDETINYNYQDNKEYTPNSKLCKHGRTKCMLGSCKRTDASSSKKNSQLLPLPPTTNHLTQAKKNISVLKNTNFVLKCLIDSVIICPVSASILGDRNDKELAFNNGTCAMKLALQTLLRPRGPAPTKQLEIEAAFHETQLLRLLFIVKLTSSQLKLIRDKAQEFLNRDLHATYTNQNSIPPIAFAIYVYNALSYNYHINKRTEQVNPPSDSHVNHYRHPNDENLALSVALAVLRLRPRFAGNPMLLEYIRKQRGDIVLELLRRNVDNKEKLNLILDRFLDPEIHLIYNSYKTNALLTGSCKGSHQSQFCTCWRKFESTLPVCSKQSSISTSSNSSRRQSEKSIEELIERTTTKLQKLGSSSDEQPDSPSTNNTKTSEENSPLRQFSSSTSSGISNCHQELDQPCSSQQAAQFDKVEVNPTPLKNVSQRNYITDYGTEEESLFLIELAKKLCVDPSNSHNNGHVNNVPRQLQMCAFIIGLYSLGVSTHVGVGDTWRIRTYSTPVTWIRTKALEVGLDAISILSDVWETHLTPAEAVELADNAGRNANPVFLDSAMRLILNVLSKASCALTLTEFQKSLTLCSEFGVHHLEQACLAVEESINGQGNMSPSNYFKVAEHWYTLHKQQTMDPGPGIYHNVTKMGNYQAPYWGNYASLIHEHHPQLNVPPPPNNFMGVHMRVPIMPPINVNQSPPKLHVSHSAPNLQPNGIRIFQAEGTGNSVQMGGQPVSGIMPLRNVQLPSVPLNKHQFNPLNTHMYHMKDPLRWRLQKVYDMGMRAFNAMGSHSLDETLHYKFIKQPEYSKEITLLFHVAIELGSQYLHQFCFGVVKHIGDPFILKDIFFSCLPTFKQCNYCKEPVNLKSQPKPYESHRQTEISNNFPPCMANLVERFRECIWKSTSFKLGHSRPLLETDKEDLIELVALAHRFFWSLNSGGLGMELLNEYSTQFQGKRLMDLWNEGRARSSLKRPY